MDALSAQDGRPQELPFDLGWIVIGGSALRCELCGGGLELEYREPILVSVQCGAFVERHARCWRRRT